MVGESDTDDEYDIKIVWEGGTHGRKGKLDGPVIEEKDKELLEDVISFKDRGNTHYAKNEYKQALVMYTKGIQLCMEKRKGISDGDDSSFCGILGILYSNVSATAYKMNKYPSAIEAARRAAEFSPKWTKPYHRMAEAYLRNENYAAAVGACRKGEALCQLSSDGLSEFTGLYDKIVVLAAASGHDYVYSGRRLEVREAGKDAWLGKPAPHVPELDGPLDESTALASDDLSCAANGHSAEVGSSSRAITNEMDGGKAREDALVSWDYSKSSLSSQAQRTSFRCIQEAYNAARDGDRIVLLKGTHNGLGETLSIKKRILIEGEGMLGDTVLDQRANVPMFKIERGGVVIRNIDLDHTGFRESILIQGPKTSLPLIERCIIKYVCCIICLRIKLQLSPCSLLVVRINAK
jgi:tetratricopeptide (TPR) repeat protein